MRKKILIGSILVLAMLLLMPSIPNVSADDVIEDIDFCFIRGKYNTIEEYGNGYKITCERGDMLVKGVNVYFPYLWYPRYEFFFTRDFIEIHTPPFFGIITSNYIWGVARYPIL